MVKRFLVAFLQINSVIYSFQRVQFNRSHLLGTGIVRYDSDRPDGILIRLRVAGHSHRTATRNRTTAGKQTGTHGYELETMSEANERVEVLLLESCFRNICLLLYAHVDENNHSAP